jgi:hypothetical protein
MYPKRPTYYVCGACLDGRHSDCDGSDDSCGFNCRSQPSQA